MRISDWSSDVCSSDLDATLHVLSHALHYASCVFEGERVYNGRIFKLTEHTERLVAGARTMDFEIPWSVAEIDAACNEVVAAQGIRSEEHTSELQSLMRISYAVFCLKQKTKQHNQKPQNPNTVRATIRSTD